MAGKDAQTGIRIGEEARAPDGDPTERWPYRKPSGRWRTAFAAGSFREDERVGLGAAGRGSPVRPVVTRADRNACSRLFGVSAPERCRENGRRGVVAKLLGGPRNRHGQRGAMVTQGRML